METSDKGLQEFDVVLRTLSAIYSLRFFYIYKLFVMCYYMLRLKLKGKIMSLENRINCPNCFDGKILTAVHPKTSDRIYMCDKCKDIFEDKNFEKCYSYDTFWLKTNRKEEDYISWEYIIK